MEKCFTGFNTKEVTLFCNTATDVGAVVKLYEAGMVTNAGADEKFCGVCTAIRNTYASVVMAGYATATYSGTAPTVGYCMLASDGDGGVKISDSGREYLVVGVDTANSTIEFII